MFFVNTDYSKEIQKAKIYLAKPNKTVISHIYEKSNTTMNLKLGGIHELSFSIPHFINEESESQRNPHVDNIKEKMLLKVVLGGMSEWFIIDSIDEDGSVEDRFNVTAFSLGYELSHKSIPELNATTTYGDMVREVLNETSWEFQENIDSEEDAIRTLELNDTNALDAILQISEAFNRIINWDTNTKKISFKKLEDIGHFKGLKLDYSRLLKTIKRTRTTDELVTRMYAFGNEGLSIAGVNPTGQSYIEDFSFFMYPFERSGTKTLKSSHFMSDGLCHALLNHKELLDSNSTEINRLMVLTLEKEGFLVREQVTLDTLNLELQSINYRLDTAKASEDGGLISQISIEKSVKESEIASQNLVVNSLKAEIIVNNNTIETLRNRIATQAGFTPELKNELKSFIIEKKWNDERYIDAQELFDDAKKRFISLREPKVVITVDIENLFEMIEEQYYWDKLNLGDKVRVTYPQMKIEYTARIIEINYDFESGSISITIANTEKKGDEYELLNELLSKSQSATSIIENHKYKWDRVRDVQDEVYKLINSEWDANKRKILAGVNNQIEIGNKGIILTNPDFPKEMVIMQAGIIALSKDGGDTWKTAIKPDGIVAERIVGNLIAGRNLVITNGSKTFTVDEDGVRIVGASLEITGGLPVSQLDQDYVNSVNVEIQEAKEAIENLENEVNIIFEDSTITELEARTLELSLKRAVSESRDIIDIATTLGITTQKTNYSNALNELNTYLLGKYINKSSYPITVTDSERNDINTKFANVEDKKSVLINEIAKRRELNANQYTLAMIEEVNGEINDVNSQLNDLDGYIEGSFKDGIIQESEAKAIQVYINTLNTEKADVDNKYTQIYGNTYLTDATIKNELLNAKNTYNTSHTNLISSINKAISDGKTTVAEKADVDSKFSAYRTSLANLSTSFEKAVNAIGVQNSKLAEQNAKQYADAIKAEINRELTEVNNQLNDLDIYIGDSFKDGIIEESEAKAIATYINVLNTEKADVDNKYNQIYANAYLVDATLKSNLLSAKTTYNTSHSELISSINTAISDKKTTATEKQAVDTKFASYRTALANLSTSFERAINAIGLEKARVAENNAKEYVNTIRTAINNELQDINGQLDSLSGYIGNSFRDGVIEESEAIAISTYINSLNTEKLDLDNKYTLVYANTSLVNATVKSELSLSKSAYNTAHTNLISAINSAISDRKTTTAEKSNVDSKFASYRTALANLSSSFEKAIDAIAIEKARVAELNAKNASVGKGEVLNGVKIDAQSGLVVTTSDNKTKVTLNGTRGFAIQKNTASSTSPSYSDVFSIDTNGNVVLKNGVISWGDVNAPSASDTGALPSNSTILTKLTSNGVYTGTVATNQLVAGTAKISTALIESLVVGSNVSMGSNASISWSNVSGKPTIPTTAGEVGALPSTYINAEGIWTGKVSASSITTGTMSADKISGGTISSITISSSTISGATITGGTISVTTDVTVGNTIKVGKETDNNIKMLDFRSGSGSLGRISFNPSYGEFTVATYNQLTLRASLMKMEGGYLDFTQVLGIDWGNNKPTAVFG